MCQTPSASSFTDATLSDRSVRHAGAAAGVAAVLCELLQPDDLELALPPRRVLRGETFDQPPDPVAHLKREVGSGGPGERADVLDRHRARQPVRSLGLAHFFPFGGAG